MRTEFGRRFEQMLSALSTADLRRLAIECGVPADAFEEQVEFTVPVEVSATKLMPHGKCSDHEYHDYEQTLAGAA